MISSKKKTIEKFSKLSILLFVLFFSRNILRNVKDGLIASDIGTESISFIAIFLHVPIAFFILKLYNKFLSVKSLIKNFAFALSIFLGYFFVFAFIIYPNKNFFHPSKDFVDSAISIFPNLKWVIRIMGNWSVALFSVFSELWVTIICSISYWQLANNASTIREASRFYIYFASLGQLSLVCVAPFTSFLRTKSSLFSINNSFIKFTVITVICSSVISLYLYKSIENKFVNKLEITKLGEKNKNSLSDFFGSLKFIINNRYLLMIAIITLSYSAIMTWSDGIISCIMKKKYENLQDFCNYKSKIMSCIGIFTIFFSLAGNYLLKKVSWKAVAIIIPIITLISGTLFFVTSYIYVNLYSSCLSLAVFFSGAYSTLSKAAKYSLFDSTKEMTYIPLDSNTKQRGQASVDIIADNIGKILGSGLQLFVFTLFPNVLHENLISPLFFLFFIMAILWIYAVNSLGKMYEKKIIDKNLYE